MNDELLAAAERYLSLGLHVIALTGKTPNVKVHPHGIKDFVASDSVFSGYGLDGALRRLFEHTDTTGIGIATSFPYVVVDIDGEQGAQVWKGIAGDQFLPDRWVARTGRGLHLWYGCLTPTGTLKLGEKLDLKGEGGYVAAPPSRHPDGHLYEWLLPPTGVPEEVPDALREIIENRAFDREGRIIRAKQQKRIRHEALEDGILYAAWGFDSLIEGMRNAEVGNRNNYLHWAASVMAEDGASEEEFEQLRLAAPDLGVAAKRTIRSARRKHA